MRNQNPFQRKKTVDHFRFCKKTKQKTSPFPPKPVCALLSRQRSSDHWGGTKIAQQAHNTTTIPAFISGSWVPAGTVTKYQSLKLYVDIFFNVEGADKPLQHHCTHRAGLANASQTSNCVFALFWNWLRNPAAAVSLPLLMEFLRQPLKVLTGCLSQQIFKLGQNTILPKTFSDWIQIKIRSVLTLIKVFVYTRWYYTQTVMHLTSWIHFKIWCWWLLFQAVNNCCLRLLMFAVHASPWLFSKNPWERRTLL